VHRNGDKGLLKQLSEEMFLFDGSKILGTFGKEASPFLFC